MSVSDKKPNLVKIERFRLGSRRIYEHETLGEFLSWAVENKASDVVFRSDDYIWMRANGVWLEVTERKIRGPEVEELIKYTRGTPDAAGRVRMGHPLDYAFEVIQDGGMSASRKSLRFRVNATAARTPRSDGFSVCLRTIPEYPPTMDEIGVPQAIRDAIFPKFGLVLVVGPVGSGKSTLLFSALRYIAENKQQHIITYEHPIEFDLVGLKNRVALVEQTEVGIHMESFSQAPPNSLRRAGDVVLFGESRDPETMRYMTLVAETGVAVYTTLHSNSVSSTIQRMVNEFPHAEREAMAASIIGALRLIVHQRLVRRPDGKGRTAIQEFMVFDDDFSRRLLGVELEEQSNFIEKEIRERGTDLLSDIKRKYEQGLVHEVDYAEYVKALS